MTQHYMLGILVLVSCSFLGVWTYPSNNDGSTQYIPFYGGARGQYLEIKKDTSGKITSEKIVSQENISNEDILKTSGDSLLTQVMIKNLQNVRTLSTSLLKLTNLGRLTGTLDKTLKTRYETQLASLGEAASNIIVLIDEIDDIDDLFKKNSTLRRNSYETGDYVSEEGIGIEASNDDTDTADNGLEKGAIAEAKPVGLAVIGQSGLAASRPVATAVAANGAAIARPIATAIAGVDPTALGIHFQLNKEHSKISKL